MVKKETQEKPREKVKNSEVSFLKGFVLFLGIKEPQKFPHQFPICLGAVEVSS